MACTWLIFEQVTIESIGDPPRIVVARLNEVVVELNQCGLHHTLHFQWVGRPPSQRHRETDDEGKIVYEMLLLLLLLLLFRNCK